MTKKFIVIDTETAPVVPSDEVDPRNMRVYDLGWIVTDRDGVIYEQRSYIIANTFFNHALMQGAYYADKLPQYYQGMGTAWEVISFLDAYKQFAADVKQYNVRDIWAYNARFDRSALNATIEDYSNGFRAFFYPFGCKVRDIWDYAGSTICNTKKYVAWCRENGFVSDKGNPQTSAEVVYRYITGRNDFAEAHTALNDCEIELSILRAARKRHQKARKSMGQGWRDAAKIAKNNPAK